MHRNKRNGVAPGHQALNQRLGAGRHWSMGRNASTEERRDRNGQAARREYDAACFVCTQEHTMRGTPCTQQGRTAQSEYLNALGEKLTDAMSTCFENKKLFKFEHVDIGSELEKRGLLNIWPSEVL